MNTLSLVTCHMEKWELFWFFPIPIFYTTPVSAERGGVSECTKRMCPTSSHKGQHCLGLRLRVTAMCDIFSVAFQRWLLFTDFTWIQDFVQTPCWLLSIQVVSFDNQGENSLQKPPYAETQSETLSTAGFMYITFSFPKCSQHVAINLNYLGGIRVIGHSVCCEHLSLSSACNLIFLAWMSTTFPIQAVWSCVAEVFGLGFTL